MVVLIGGKEKHDKFHVIDGERNKEMPFNWDNGNILYAWHRKT